MRERERDRERERENASYDLDLAVSSFSRYWANPDSVWDNLIRTPESRSLATLRMCEAQCATLKMRIFIIGNFITLFIKKTCNLFI
jgi:hypothetical protein